MKLPFGENLSHGLGEILAREHGFAIVSKDTDFREGGFG